MTHRSKTGKSKGLPARLACRVVLVLLCCLGGLTGALPPANAAQSQSAAGDATVSAAVADPAVDVGETTQYQITVLGASEEKAPAVPVVDGLTFSYLGPSQQRSFGFDSRGQMINSVRLIYVYSVRGSRPGTFTIPGQDVDVRGSTLRTLPVTLTVQDPGAPAPTPPGQKVFSELIVPKKTAYVGESFLAELRAYFGGNVNVIQPAPEPTLSGGGFSVGKFTRPHAGPVTVDGTPYLAVTYRTAITGVKTGTVSIGPVDTMPVVQIPRSPTRRRRSRGGLFGDEDDDPFNMFGGMGMRLEPPQQIKVTAPAVSVEVLPLPPGKPDDFSGGIGDFHLEAEATPRRAQVGDPVTVRLVLTGKGNFPRVNAPTLTDDHGLRTYPATAQFKADDDVGLSGTKTFEQVVVSDGPRDALPAYHFNYLDPATGKYVSLDTTPVAVKIEGNAVAAPTVSTAPSAVSSSPEPTPTPTPRPAQDILYIRSDPGPMHSRTYFLPVYRRPIFWWAQLLPCAALLGAAVGLGVRVRGRNEGARRQAALLRQRGQLQRALRQETTSRRDFYTAATRLAQIQAADPRGNDRPSAAEIVQARDLDPRTADSVREIFHRHDELAYSGGQVAQETVPSAERQTVLATLETLGKTGR